jgi:hypothetical protein
MSQERSFGRAASAFDESACKAGGIMRISESAFALVFTTLSIWQIAWSAVAEASDCGTASACAHSDMQAASNVARGLSIGNVQGACPVGELCLVSTVGTDLSADACAATHTIDAAVGGQINFCYTVTNNTGMALDFHALGDDVYGVLFGLMSLPIPSGSTYQFNRIATVGATHAYTATWVSQDLPPGYSFVLESEACADRIFADGFDHPLAPCTGQANQFVDITATGTPLGLSDEESFGMNAPFPITLYDTTSDWICIDNNGFVLVGVVQCPAYLPPYGPFYSFNEALPAPDLPGAAILPLWDDFGNTSFDPTFGSGDVYYDTRGVAPNRQFIVEWFDHLHYGQVYRNEDTATFELIFNEDGTFQFEYPDITYTAYQNPGGDPDICDGGLCATVGLQQDATSFNAFSAFEASITNNTGILWTVNHPEVFVGSDTAVVNVGAPLIAVNPDSIVGSVSAGGTAVIPFAVENHGNRDLQWNLGQAASSNPSNLHFAPPGMRYAMPMGDPAKATAAPAPRHAGPVTVTRNGTGRVLQAGGIPAFASISFSFPAPMTELYTFEAATGNDQNFIGFSNDTIFALKFLDDDFSKAYALGKWGSQANLFATISTVDGTITPIASAQPSADGDGFTGFAPDPTTGALYASGTTCGTSSHLYTVDRYTGATSVIGELPDMPCAIWIAISPEGFMYGVDVVNDAFYAIDKTTGATSLKGTVGFDTNHTQDADFDRSSGVLYWAAVNEDSFSGEMRTIDLDTGATTLLYPLSLYAAGLGLETAGGPCAQPQDLPWLSLDSTSGTTSPSGSSPVIASIDGTQAVPGDVLQGTICARSNDPLHRTLAVPVSVSVQ